MTSLPDPIPFPVAPQPLVPGTLYLVATPIGHLLDITLRAIHVLREVDRVAAEDTRHTGLLLQALGLRKPLVSCHQFNEARRSVELLDALRAGQTLALVSDAGTPGISDPGQRLVALARQSGIRIEPIPGPCAAIAALTASGMPTDEFHFVGFLPVKAGQRKRRLTEILPLPGTLVLYESPFRVQKLLGELAVLAPGRPLVVARELTKKFEEWLLGTPESLLLQWQQRPRKGEFVVVVGPATEDCRTTGDVQPGP
jgi:16S rRNA (cytidine1402-2'-O)-methyltransferase